MFNCCMDANIEFLKGLVSRGDCGSERVNAWSLAVRFNLIGARIPTNASVGAAVTLLSPVLCGTVLIYAFSLAVSTATLPTCRYRSNGSFLSYCLLCVSQQMFSELK